MLEYMVIALILAKFCEKGAIDITSMITGNQPPSKTFQAAKGTTKEAGPLGKFVKAWWADAIEDLDEKRRIKRMATKEEQEEARARRKAERQRILDAIDEKAKADKTEREEREPARDIPVEEPPDPRDSEAGEPLPIDEGPGEVLPQVDEQPRAEDPEQTIPDPLPWEMPEERPKTTVEPDEPLPWEALDREEVVQATVDPDQGHTRQEPDSEIVDADIVEEAPEIQAGPQGPGIPEFKVVAGDVKSPADDTEWKPFHAKPQLYAVKDQEIPASTAGPTEGTNVTTQAVAVEGGITQHIGWTAAVADYQVQAANHVEMVAAMMFQGENGPERLALVARIQEGHRILREMYLQLNAALVSDKNLVGDAYAATGGQAGGKPYVTS